MFIKRPLHHGRSRPRTTAALAGARLPITVDIRFGDAIAHGTEDMNLSVLLDIPSPYLRAYPPETVIAEKVHADGGAAARQQPHEALLRRLNAHELFDPDPERSRQAIAATFARHVGPGPGT